MHILLCIGWSIFRLVGFPAWRERGVLFAVTFEDLLMQMWAMFAHWGRLRGGRNSLDMLNGAHIDAARSHWMRIQIEFRKSISGNRFRYIDLKSPAPHYTRMRTQIDAESACLVPMWSGWRQLSTLITSRRRDVSSRDTMDLFHGPGRHYVP
jgi:hypothetical protein